MEEHMIIEPEFKTPIDKAKPTPKSKSKTTCSSHTPLEEAKSVFMGKLGWQDAAHTINELSFDCHPKITHEYGMSYLIQCAELNLGC